MTAAVADQLRAMTPPEDRRDVWFRMGALPGQVTRGAAALDHLDEIGRSSIELRPLFTTEYLTPDEARHVPIKERAVFRIGRDKQELIGTAGPKWVPTQPADVAAAVRRINVRPAALVDTGNRILIGWDEGEMDILGDPITLMGCAVVGFAPNYATVLVESGVRLECTNQVHRGLEANGGVGLIHRGNVRENLARWFIEMYATSKDASLSMREHFTRMASRSVSDFDLDRVVEKLLPLPRSTRRTTKGPDEVDFTQRAESRQAEVRAARQKLLALIDGAGTGLDTRATRGTLYGAYHGWTEYVTWIDTPDTVKGAESLLLGDGAAALERGYQLFLELATGKHPDLRRS